MRKKSLIFSVSILLATCFLLPVSSYAKPERVLIQAGPKKEKVEAAKEASRNVHLEDIQDPEAKKAIRAILQYLDMPYKN